MKMRTGLMLLAPALLTACAATPEGHDDRVRQREAALAEAGAGAQVLGVCGPFQAVEGANPAIISPPAGKFIAFVQRGDETVLILEPFVIPANPPVTPDGAIVAVDQEGRPLPAAARAQNTELTRQTQTRLWGSTFTVTLWRADVQGAPVGEDRETYSASKNWFGHKATAEVSINGRTSRFTAACE